jgi:membrane protein YqaA with SNARE-associated domain
MRWITQWFITLFASPAGVFALAALDSTLFFSLPFGIDTAVIILAARLGQRFWIVPLLATAGSTAGAALTFWMGIKVGEQGLEKYVPANRLRKVRARVRNRGAVALAVLDLIPPPFPFTPFVLAAGALEVKASTFFVTLVVCRLVRFGIESVLAIRFGHRVLSWIDSGLFHDLVLCVIAVALVLTIVSIVRLARSTRPRRAQRG